MKNKIYVVGGSLIDICGYSFEPLKEKDSNPGNISLSLGGVGRNIAENASMLEDEVYLVSAFSCDSFGQLLKDACKKAHINCEYSIDVKDVQSGLYLALLDEHKDMHIAMSDVRILEELTCEHIEKVLTKVKSEDTLVIDTNLNKDLIAYLLDNKKCQIAMDPISSIKAQKLKDLNLCNIDIFKPNVYEAEMFTNIRIVDKESALANLDYFIKRGIKEVIISLGDRGVLFANKDSRLWLSHKHFEPVNASGAGDAFLAAYLVYRKRVGCLKALHYAIGAAVLAISSVDTINHQLCDTILESKIKELNIEEINLCI